MPIGAEGALNAGAEGGRGAAPPSASDASPNAVEGLSTAGARPELPSELFRNGWFAEEAAVLVVEEPTGMPPLPERLTEGALAGAACVALCAKAL